ncbi:MAG: hypothetical protein ACUVWR_11925 [Anaerolineae bacterium]
MYMVMFVLDNPDRLYDVLAAWRKAGIGGATIMESTGIHRLQRCARIHARFDFAHLAEGCELGHYTLLAIVKDEATVQACLRACESIVGDLDEPNTGVLAAWPLSLVKGVAGSAATAGRG